MRSATSCPLCLPECEHLLDDRQNSIAHSLNILESALGALIGDNSLLDLREDRCFHPLGERVRFPPTFGHTVSACHFLKPTRQLFWRFLRLCQTKIAQLTEGR